MREGVLGCDRLALINVSAEPLITILVCSRVIVAESCPTWHLVICPTLLGENMSLIHRWKMTAVEVHRLQIRVCCGEPSQPPVSLVDQSS
jgi:hypothetical protein